MSRPETLLQAYERVLAERDSLLIHARGALAAITQPACLPADLAVARTYLQRAIECVADQPTDPT